MNSRWLALGAAITAVCLQLRVAVSHGLHFDEAFNLQIPLNLVLSGSYATWYEQTRPFDPRITTGPTVLLPVAAVFSVASPTREAARTVMLLFLGVYLYALLRVCRDLSRRAGALLFAASVLSWARLPDSVATSAVVLGEMPAMAFFLLATHLLSEAVARSDRRRAAVAGVFFGFATLTKLQFAVFAAGIPLALAAHRQVGVWKLFAPTLAVALAPLVGWEALKWILLGGAAYRFHVINQVEVIVFSGSGITTPVMGRGQQGLVAHLQLLGAYLGVSGGTTAVLMAAAFTLLLVLLVRRQTPFVARLLAAAALCYWAWWLLLNSALLYRHAIPALMLLGVLIPYTFANTFAPVESCPERLGVRVGIGLLAAAPFFLIFPLAKPSWPSYQPSWLDQRLVATSVVRLVRDHNAVIWAHGWAQAPEISFLAQVPFRDITVASPEGKNHYFVVSDMLGKAQAYANAHCQEWLIRGADFELCRLRSVP